MDNYGVMARDYLARARERLLDGSKAALFHAALELRCCVEARQAEYLEHQTVKPGRKFQPYKLGEAEKTIRRIYAGEGIFRLKISGSGARLFEATHYHTPVPRALVAFCERKVDALRHAQLHYRGPEDPWWNKTRRALVEHYRMAWLACRGTIMMPPLWNRKTGEMTPIHFQLGDGGEYLAGEDYAAMVGRKITLGVDYLEEPPPDWECDL